MTDTIPPSFRVVYDDDSRAENGTHIFRYRGQDVTDTINQLGFYLVMEGEGVLDGRCVPVEDPAVVDVADLLAGLIADRLDEIWSLDDDDDDEVADEPWWASLFRDGHGEQVNAHIPKIEFRTGLDEPEPEPIDRAQAALHAAGYSEWDTPAILNTIANAVPGIFEAAR